MIYTIDREFGITSLLVANCSILTECLYDSYLRKLQDRITNQFLSILQPTDHDIAGVGLMETYSVRRNSNFLERRGVEISKHILIRIDE